MTRKPVVLTVGVSAVMAARLRRSSAGQDAYDLIETISETDAVEILNSISPRVVMVSTVLQSGCPLSISDYVAFRCPEARVIFEMDERVGFLDGSLFAHSYNARAMVTPGMHVDDVSAVVAHHAEERLTA